MFTLCSWRDKKYKEILQCNYLNQGSWMKVIHSLCLWKKNAAILKFLVNWPLKWKYLNSNTEESFFQTLLIQTYSTSLKFHWHPLLFGHSPNRIFRITCFDLKLQKACNTCERKQANSHKCVPCERLIQGKKYAGKKNLLAGSLSH